MAHFGHWYYLVGFCFAVFGLTLDFLRRREGKLPPARISEQVGASVLLTCTFGLWLNAFLGSKFEMAIINVMLAASFIFLIVDRVPKSRIRLSILALVLAFLCGYPIPVSRWWAAEEWAELLVTFVGALAWIYVLGVATWYGFVERPQDHSPPESSSQPIR